MKIQFTSQRRVLDVEHDCGGRLIFRGLDLPPEAFAVVGMAAFFTGVVRAPITGIVLIVEMTTGFTMLLPMLMACFVAMLIPTVLGNAPIYDSLRERPQP